MKKQSTYKSFDIETINAGTNNEQSIAFRNGKPVYAAMSDWDKFNSLEKVKAKIDKQSKTIIWK